MDQSVSSGSVKGNFPSRSRGMVEKRTRESGKGTDFARKRVKLKEVDSLCIPQVRTQPSESSITKEATVVQSVISGKLRESLEETRNSDQRSDIYSNFLGHQTGIIDGTVLSLSSNHEVVASRVAEASVTLLSDTYQEITPGRNALSLLGAAACLSLGNVDNPEAPVALQSKAQIANKLVGDSKLGSVKNIGESKLGSVKNIGESKLGSVKNIGESSFSTEMGKNHEINEGNTVGQVDDLRPSQLAESQKDTENIICIKNQDRFCTSINLSHLKSKESLDFDSKTSECGSTTGPLEETDPWKMWKAMKQNGFLSSQALAPLHRDNPIPKVRSQFRKNKSDVLKKKLELAKKEQVNRFTKIAAPSGLLTELNPGIINHVRNSKQVHSIIKALVKSEKLDVRIQNRPMNQSRRTKEIKGLMKDFEGTQDSGHSEGSGISFNSDEDVENPKFFSGSKKIRDGHLRILNRSSLSFCLEYNGKPSIASTLERGKDEPLQKQLSGLAKPTENARCLSIEELSASQDSVTSLSVKAATVASQWLELLSQDLGGRLSALKRSKKRVRSMIHTELPLMVSRELSSTHQNDQNFSQSSDAGSTMNAAQEMHVARWRTLFDQMDKALSEEGKHLENRLREVKEMQAHCVRGLQLVDRTSTNGLPELELSGNKSRPNKAEFLEREAVRAAAASIYSTCNLVMTTENVSCF